MIPKIGLVVQRIDELDSTNRYVSSLLLTKRPPEGSVIITNNQVAGRGQASNKWESEPDSNLTFSIILYPDFIEISQQFEISKVISLGVVDFLKRYTDSVSIKWPNDIYIGKKKAAGILMEYSVRQKKISSCVVGIGLNINQKQFLSEAPNPVSLTQLTGITYDLEACLTELLNKLDSRYCELRNSGTSKIDAEYEQLLYQKDIWSSYSSKTEEFEGKITGVDENGLLMIETRQHNILKFDYKEVVFNL